MVKQVLNPCPKPSTKKSVKNSKHQSNPRPTEEDYCIVCGKPFAETHECFGAANRNNSIKYGLQVRLCAEHHRGTTGVHGKHGILLRTQLEEWAQTKFEKDHTREEFIKIFGKSCL